MMMKEISIIILYQFVNNCFANRLSKNIKYVVCEDYQFVNINNVQCCPSIGVSHFDNDYRLLHQQLVSQ